MVKDELYDGFTHVDTTKERRIYTDYLEFIDSLRCFREIKEHTYRLLDLRDGSAVLEAGCGVGFDAIRLASMVGTRGRVTGVDISETMICQARSYVTGKDLPLDFLTGDLHKLQFPDKSFDAVRIDRTLQHIGDPGPVVAELARVIRPGGRLVAVEPDWGSPLFDPADKNVTRRVLDYFCDVVPCGWIGRQLPRLFRDAGLEEICIIPQPVVMTDYSTVSKVYALPDMLASAVSTGALSERESIEWLQGLKDADAEGRFLCAWMFLTVMGIHP